MTTDAAAAEASVATAPAKKPTFFGWKVAGASAVIQGLQGALILNAFGNYAVIFRERFGWSKTTISIAYSFNRAESGLLGPLQGWALHRFGSRRVMRVGSVVMTIGFLWFSQISSPVLFVASFFVISVGAGLCGFLTVSTEIVKWFDRRRTRALSLMTAGFAVGGLLTPAVVLCLRQFGWRETAVGSGLVLGVSTFLLASLFGRSPTGREDAVDGDAAELHHDETRRVADSRHFSAREALRTPAFWFISLGHASALLVVGALIAHLSLFLTTERGFSLQSASFVVAGLPIAQLAGMVLGGALGDLVSKRLLCAVAMLGHVFGLLLLAFATRTWMVWAFVLLHGAAWGMRGPIMTAIRADYFGSTSYGQIMGYSSLILMFGVVGGPLFAGILADATGSYRIGFTILAGLAATGSVLFALATPPVTHDRQ